MVVEVVRKGMVVVVGWLGEGWWCSDVYLGPRLNVD